MLDRVRSVERTAGLRVGDGKDPRRTRVGEEVIHGARALAGAPERVLPADEVVEDLSCFLCSLRLELFDPLLSELPVDVFSLFGALHDLGDVACRVGAPLDLFLDELGLELVCLTVAVLDGRILIDVLELLEVLLLLGHLILGSSLLALLLRLLRIELRENLLLERERDGDGAQTARHGLQTEVDLLRELLLFVLREQLGEYFALHLAIEDDIRILEVCLGDLGRVQSRALDGRRDADDGIRVL